MQFFLLSHPWIIRPLRFISVALIVSCIAAVLWSCWAQASAADKRERALEAANREN